jgi:hypothetical protein
MFFILLKRSWISNIKNGLTFYIWKSKAQTIAKRKVKNQIGNLIFYHYIPKNRGQMTSKLNIQYIIKNISSKPQPLPLKLLNQSLYAWVMNLWDSWLSNYQEFHLRILKIYSTFNVALVTNHKIYYKEKNDATSKGFGSCESSKVLSCPWLYHRIT